MGPTRVISSACVLLGALSGGCTVHATAVAELDELALIQRGRTVASDDAKISRDVLDAIKDSVNADFCKQHWNEAKRYSMDWHGVLRNVSGAMRKMLPQGSAARATALGGDVYAFGVAQGQSMRVLHGIFPDNKLLGFDGFKGLPKEDVAQKLEQWYAGNFRAKMAAEKVVESAGGPEFARVVMGFFNESLTNDLAKAMRPAAYVDVDCDLHVSTYDALDWLFAHRIARVGTIIGYDDWWTIACNKHHGSEPETGSPLVSGEGLAHVEMAKKYGVVFKCVAGPCEPVPDLTKCHRNNNWGPIFVVAAVGAPEGNHGFEFTAEQELHWMENSQICRNMH